MGVSAYQGANLDAGLGQFLEAVRTGKIKPGSYLIVESLDRISRREPWDAFTTFQEIINAEINLITLEPSETEYSLQAIREQPHLLYPVLGVMQRAHEESKIKSQRGRAAWGQKKKRARETGEVTTRSVPQWLRVKQDSEGRRFAEIDKRKAKVVRRIFELARDGWGTQRIAVTFNTEGVKVFGRGNGWTQSYIRLILKNAAVIGQYQPMKNIHENGKNERIPDGDPVEDYFPAVIEPALFYSVKHTKRGPSGVGDGLQKNLLSKLVFCGKCGGKMHYVNKGSGHVYLECDNRRRFRSCDAPAVPYFPTFSYVMLELNDFRPFEADANAVQERERELDALAGQIAETQEAIGRLVDSLERVQSSTMEQRLADKETELSALKVLRNVLREKAATATTRARPLDIGIANIDDDPLGEYIIFEGERRVPADKVELVRRGRAHIAAEIRRVVERVEVIKGEPVKVIPKE
jgi:DNA invertase Pin-like site-specific DNA recombinase